jgi:hypothetical protein
MILTTSSERVAGGLIMDSCRLGRRSARFLQWTETTALNLLLLCVLGLSVDTGGAQVRATQTEPAMQCTDTSKCDAGDVVVTNTCDFRITIQTSTPERNAVDQESRSPRIRFCRSLVPRLVAGLCLYLAGNSHGPGRRERTDLCHSEIRVRCADGIREPSNPRPNPMTRSRRI